MPHDAQNIHAQRDRVDLEHGFNRRRRRAAGDDVGRRRVLLMDCGDRGDGEFRIGDRERERLWFDRDHSAGGEAAEAATGNASLPGAT